MTAAAPVRIFTNATPNRQEALTKRAECNNCARGAYVQASINLHRVQRTPGWGGQSHNWGSGIGRRACPAAPAELKLAWRVVRRADIPLWVVCWWCWVVCGGLVADVVSDDWWQDEWCFAEECA